MLGVKSNEKLIKLLTKTLQSDNLACDTAPPETRINLVTNV